MFFNSEDWRSGWEGEKEGRRQGRKDGGERGREEMDREDKFSFISSLSKLQQCPGLELKLGAGNSVQVSYLGYSNPTFWAVSSLSCRVWQEVGVRSQSYGLNIRIPVWDVCLYLWLTCLHWCVLEKSLNCRAATKKKLLWARADKGLTA